MDIVAGQVAYALQRRPVCADLDPSSPSTAPSLLIDPFPSPLSFNYASSLPSAILRKCDRD